MSSIPPDPPEVIMVQTAHATATDLAELAHLVPGDTERNAKIADRIAEEAAELGLRLRCLPGAPIAMSGRDAAALMAFRTAVAEGEDIGEFIARALARLVWELGQGADAVTANRPGSWEAAIIADLIERTCGDGDDVYRVCAP